MIRGIAVKILGKKTHNKKPDVSVFDKQPVEAISIEELINPFVKDNNKIDYWETREEEIKTDREIYKQNKERINAKYNRKYIAIFDGVIYSSDSFLSLQDYIRPIAKHSAMSKYGCDSRHVFIIRVGDEQDEERGAGLSLTMKLDR